MATNKTVVLTAGVEIQLPRVSRIENKLDATVAYSYVPFSDNAQGFILRKDEARDFANATDIYVKSVENATIEVELASVSAAAGVLTTATPKPASALANPNSTEESLVTGKTLAERDALLQLSVADIVTGTETVPKHVTAKTFHDAIEQTIIDDLDNIKDKLFKKSGVFDEASIGTFVFGQPTKENGLIPVDGRTVDDKPLADFLTANPIKGFVVTGTQVTTPDWRGRHMTMPGKLEAMGVVGTLLEDTLREHVHQINISDGVGTKGFTPGNSSGRKDATTPTGDSVTRGPTALMHICIIGDRQMTVVGASTKALEDRVKVLEDEVNALNSATGASLKPSVDKNKLDIKQLQQDLASTDADVGANKQNILGLKQRVDALATKINQVEGTANNAKAEAEQAKISAQDSLTKAVANQAEILALEQSIVNERQDITNLTTRVNTNEIDIATNKQVSEKNKTDILTLAKRMDQDDAEDIQLEQTVTQNTTDLAALKMRMDKDDSDDTNLKNRVDTLENADVLAQAKQYADDQDKLKENKLNSTTLPAVGSEKTLGLNVNDTTLQKVVEKLSAYEVVPQQLKPLTIENTDLGRIIHAVPDATKGIYEINGAVVVDAKLATYIANNPITGFVVTGDSIQLPDWRGRYIGATGSLGIPAGAGELLASEVKKHRHVIGTNNTAGGNAWGANALYYSNTGSTPNSSVLSSEVGGTFGRPETVAMPICIVGSSTVQIANVDLNSTQIDLTGITDGDLVQWDSQLKHFKPVTPSTIAGFSAISGQVTDWNSKTTNFTVMENQTVVISIDCSAYRATAGSMGLRVLLDGAVVKTTKSMIVPANQHAMFTMPKIILDNLTVGTHTLTFETDVDTIADFNDVLNWAIELHTHTIRKVIW